MREPIIEPALKRTDRICSTPNCARSALFFPVILIWQKGISVKKHQPHQCELTCQYCPGCHEKINTLTDLGINNLGFDFAKACQETLSEMGCKGEIDPATGIIRWLPLIVDIPSVIEAPQMAYTGKNHD